MRESHTVPSYKGCWCIPMPIYTILPSYRLHPVQKVQLSSPLVINPAIGWAAAGGDTDICQRYLAHTKPRNSCGAGGHWEQGKTEAAGVAPDSCPCCATINPFQVAASFLLLSQKISRSSWPTALTSGSVLPWWGVHDETRRNGSGFELYL